MFFSHQSREQLRKARSTTYTLRLGSARGMTRECQGELLLLLLCFVVLLLVDLSVSSTLRVRTHNFILSPAKDNMNFVSRVLYEALCPPPDCM